MPLHYDILIGLFPLLWRSDASHLMRTCKTLYFHGPRTLLGNIITVDETNIRSLCLFLKADMTRCVHLRELVLYPIHQDRPRTIRAFARALRSAVNIRKLDIMDGTLDAQPDIAYALGKMSSIRDLCLRRWDKAASSVMASLRSPISKLDINFAPESDDIDAELFSEFLPHLSQLQSTLEELRVDWVWWESPPSKLRFPRVRTLKILQCSANLIMPLIVAFPNVSNLTLTTEDMFGPDTEQEEAMRATNIAAQRRLGSWPHINYAYVSLERLYVLAPICRIITLQIPFPPSIDQLLDQWGEALESVQPINLLTRIWTESLLTAAPEALARIPSSVRKLRLMICFLPKTSSMPECIVSSDIMYSALTGV